MGRRKEKKEEAEGAAWLITFSDLVTLLLTFFVLLLSMASMDQTILTRVNTFTQNMGFMTNTTTARVPSRLRVLIELLENPWDILEKQNRIKDLLFPDDVLPPDIDRSTLLKNIKVLRKPEGVALVLSDAVLFEPGKAELTDLARLLLTQVIDVLAYMTADVNISGHSDKTGEKMANYRLSGQRAASVLDMFLKNGMRESRFSISAYGSDRPLADNTTDEGRGQNRRVEILMKTTQWLGGYS